MRAVYFDCFSGISGDMLLGALLDLGISPEVFLAEMKKLPVSGYEILIEKKESYGIVATDVKVLLEAENREYCYLDPLLHGHENSHDHHHGHHHDHHHGQERNLFDIETILDNSRISPRAKALSKDIFRQIARAEGRVHNKDIYEVHFHEVGALDSIVDIVGVCIALDLLGIEVVYASSLRDGNGFVECRHGKLPVPVPAVMEMAIDSNIPLATQEIPMELVTPTGMAILKTVAAGFGTMPKMYVEGVGYGLGKRNTGRFNALRAVVGTLFREEVLDNEISMIEANIDDLSPQILGFTMDKLFDNGALDVFYTPIFMKKNRPAYKLSVMAKLEDTPKMEDIIFRETTTIGIRKAKWERVVMDRQMKTIDSDYGPVRVKEATLGDIKTVSVEYEDAKDIAQKHNLPLRAVLDTLSQKARGSN